MFPKAGYCTLKLSRQIFKICHDLAFTEYNFNCGYSFELSSNNDKLS